jgi:alpha-tubulin suppressor-like RCC1 family protein
MSYSGVNKPVTSPKQVSTFPIPQARQPGEDFERVRAETAAQTVYYTRGIRPVIDVACGGGFTVAVLKDTGEVCAWGTWQHGRLGRPTPLVETRRRRRFTDVSGAKRQYARYQLRPILVPGIRDAVRVACGSAHTLCLTKQGYILSWGANSWYDPLKICKF